MKKHIHSVIIVALISLSSNVFSQTLENVESAKTTKAPKSYFGLVLNLVSTNLNYGDANTALSDYKKSNKGLQAGVTFQGGITSRVSVLGEFYFLMRGGQLKSDNSLTAAKSSLRFYSLELPVLARVHFGRFYINAGPYVAYNLSGREKIEGSSRSISFNDSDAGFKRFDAGVQCGGGYGFKIKQKQILVDVRYASGLTSISNGGDMYNRYLNLSLQFINPWKTNPLARNKN
jgi:hypothetical protein